MCELNVKYQANGHQSSAPELPYGLLPFPPSSLGRRYGDARDHEHGVGGGLVLKVQPLGTAGSSVSLSFCGEFLPRDYASAPSMQAGGAE